MHLACCSSPRNGEGKKNARRRKAESAHREKWCLWTRVYVDTTTADKPLSPVPRRKYIQSCVSVHHSMPAIPDAAIRVAARRKMQSQETVVALTRESSALSTGVYSERPWILMDPLAPAELSAGTTLICIMQFTCAIYERARIVSRYAWLLVALARKNTPCFPFFPPSPIYFLLSLGDSRFLSHDISV